MEEGGPSFGKFFFSEMCRHVIAFFKVRKEAHWGHPSPPHHHWDQGGDAGEVGEEFGGGWRWFGWRGEWRESWRHLFLFSQPLAFFFGFSPLTFLIRAKMHKSKKETKGRTHDPILTHPVWGHRAGGPNGGGGGGGFFFWVDGHWRQKEILKIWFGNSNSSFLRSLQKTELKSPPPQYCRRHPSTDRLGTGWGCIEIFFSFFLSFFFFFFFEQEKKEEG